MTGTIDMASVAMERVLIDIPSPSRPHMISKRNSGNVIATPPSLAPDTIVRQAGDRISSPSLGPEFDLGLLFEQSTDSASSDKVNIAIRPHLQRASSQADTFDQISRLGERDPSERIQIWRDAYHETMRTHQNRKDRIAELAAAVGHISNTSEHGLRDSEVRNVSQEATRLGVLIITMQLKMVEHSALIRAFSDKEEYFGQLLSHARSANGSHQRSILNAVNDFIFESSHTKAVLGSSPTRERIIGEMIVNLRRIETELYLEQARVSNSNLIKTFSEHRNDARSLKKHFKAVTSADLASPLIAP